MRCSGLFSSSEIPQLLQAIDVKANDAIVLSELEHALSTHQDEGENLRNKVCVNVHGV